MTASQWIKFLNHLHKKWKKICCFLSACPPTSNFVSKIDVEQIYFWLTFKLSANVVGKYLNSIINHILQSYFSDGAKNALVRLTYKKKDRQNKEINCPVGILNGSSKAYKFKNDSMLPIMQTFLSNFVSGYRKHNSANHVLASLIENW